jgi:hypothetical protein
MAKTRQAKETSLPVIIALVFFIVTTIGLGVFVYVLYSDQEQKDAQVVAAKKDVTDMRASLKDAELIARIYRVGMGVEEGTGDTSDLVILQNEVKEGSKPYQELQKLSAALKKKGPEQAAAIAAKFDAALEQYFRALAQGGGMPPKLDTSSLFLANEFDAWPADLDDKKQIKAPRTTMLDIAIRNRILANFAMKATGDERVSYEKVVLALNTAKGDYDKSQKAYNDKAVELPKSFDAKIAELNKLVDKLRDDYKTNEANTRKEIQKREDLLDQAKLDIRNRDTQIASLRETLAVLNAKMPKVDPFAYDEPQGKILARLPDNIVEINLGSNAHVETGLTFTVLPIDFPQKGRASRMMNLRLPDDRGNYRPVQMFVPKATIEVLEVLGPDVSRARITTEYDDVRDRTLPGDLLYNAVWRKGQSDHIALIGIFDINGDGSDDIENVIRDFNKMGIPVDAYFDLKQKKWVGKLTERTRYLVDGAIPVPTANDPNVEAKAKLLGAMKAAREEAASKNVQLVPARDFFSRTGFKAKVDVSDDFINQAASKYLGGVGTDPMTPPGSNN